MKKNIGIIGLVVLVILAIILLLFANKKTNNINVTEDPNTNTTKQVDEKIYIYVERENMYHKYTSLEIDPNTEEGFLYIERKTDDSLKNLEIMLTIFDDKDQLIFKKYLGIDNESIDTNGYIKFSFVENLSTAKTYSVDIESKPYYG